MSHKTLAEPFSVALESPSAPDQLLVRLRGILDESAIADLRRVAVAIYDCPAQTVVLDLTAVPLVDSDGFGTLINMQKRLTETKRSLALVGCQEAVRMALTLTRLEVLLPCYPSLRDVPRGGKS